jgi:1-acyl-sn-glycerol-3-phosphate acyltransferase
MKQLANGSSSSACGAHHISIRLLGQLPRQDLTTMIDVPRHSFVVISNHTSYYYYYIPLMLMLHTTYACCTTIDDGIRIRHISS